MYVVLRSYDPGRGGAEVEPQARVSCCLELTYRSIL